MNRETPDYFLVVADQGGFVGAFLSAKEVIQHVIKRYPSIQTVIYKYKLDNKVSYSNIYILPYKGNEAIAWAGNNIETCRQVQKTLSKIGIVYEDDVKYWEQPVGQICETALKRFQIEIESKKTLTSSEIEKIEKQISLLTEGGELSHCEVDNEKLSILDCIVPITPNPQDQN